MSILYRCRDDMASNFPKVADFTYPPAYGAVVGVTSFEFQDVLWRQKTRVPGLSCSLRYPTFSLFCFVTDGKTDDGQTADRRTDTFEHSIYRARSRGKKWYPIIYLISLSKVSLSSASYVGSQHNTARICCWAAPLQLVRGAGAISPAHRALSSKLVARHRWCCRSMGQTDLQSTVSSN